MQTKYILPTMIKYPHEEITMRTRFTYQKENCLLVAEATDPAVLIETGAEPCTILISHNSNGEFCIVHEPFFQGIEDSGLPTQRDLDIITAFNKENNHKNPKPDIILTATNISGDLRDIVIQKVTELIDHPGNDIDVQVSDNRASTTNVGGRSDLHLTEDVIYGVVCIPYSLLNDGRNKVILLSRKHTEKDINIINLLKN